MAKGIAISKSLKAPTKPGKYHRLLCLTGKNKGISYYLSKKRIVLGRSVKADIQILDPKSSREHAELVLANGKYVVTDLGSQNGIIINDLKVKQHTLSTGDILVIGKTVLKYAYFEVKEPEKEEDDENEEYEEDYEEDDEEEEEDAEEYSYKRKNKKNNKFIIYLLGAAVVGYLFWGGGEEKKGEKAPEENLAKINDDLVRPKAKPIKQDKETQLKLKMVLHDGLREFRERNYFRAIKEFELALLLSPNNARASFYLNKTRQAMDEEIEKNFMKAKRDADSLKYRSAIVSYCAIIKLLEGYPNDQRYKDAQDNIENLTEKMGLEKGEISCF